MAYGYEIQNNSGFLQVSDEGSSFVVSSTGSLIAATELWHDNRYFAKPSADIPIPDNGMLAIRTTVPAFLINFPGDYFPGNNVGAIKDGFDNSATTLEYAVLIPSKDAAVDSGTYGLELFNASGVRMYSSRQQLATIIAVTNYTSNVPITVSLPALLPGKKRYWVANIPTPLRVIQYDPENAITKAVKFAADNLSMTIGWPGVLASTFVDNNWSGNIIIVDI